MNSADKLFNALSGMISNEIIKKMNVLTLHDDYVHVVINDCYQVDSTFNLLFEQIEQCALMTLDKQVIITIKYTNADKNVGYHYHVKQYEYFSPLELLSHKNLWLSRLAYAILCSSTSNVFCVVDDDEKWLKISHGPLIFTRKQSTEKTLDDLRKQCSSMFSNAVLNQIDVLSHDIENARKSQIASELTGKFLNETKQ